MAILGHNNTEGSNTVVPAAKIGYRDGLAFMQPAGSNLTLPEVLVDF
jgi:hypothetical protein